MSSLVIYAVYHIHHTKSRKEQKTMKRQKMRRKKDKVVYTQTANTIKKINVAPRIARGGIRL